MPPGVCGTSRTSETTGRLLLLRKETGSVTAEYYEWDPVKRTLTPLLGQGEMEEYDARYGAREGELVVLTNKLGEFRRLYAWKAGKLTPLGEDIKFDVDGFSVDRRRTRVVYTINEGFRLHAPARALDAKTFRAIALPAFPDADHVYVGDHDARRALHDARRR